MSEQVAHPKTKAAYEVFLSVYVGGEKIPAWDDLPSWLRDALAIAYLEGRKEGWKRLSACTND